LLAGDCLLAGCSYGTELELCRTANVPDAGDLGGGQTTATPQLLTHRHLLRDSSCRTCEKDKDLEGELGVIYYVKNVDHIWLIENFG